MSACLVGPLCQSKCSFFIHMETLGPFVSDRSQKLILSEYVDKTDTCT